jgi:hypothetical protein
VELEELKKAVYGLMDNRITLKSIEEDLRMPANSLSGMLSGKRPFAKKWITKLSEYVSVKKLKVPEIRKVAPINIEQAVAVHNATHPEQHTEHMSLTPRQATELIKKAPPPGLTKSQQIRWHRENTQTLQ